MLLYDIWYPSMDGKYRDLDSSTPLPAPVLKNAGAVAHCVNGEDRWLRNDGGAWESITRKQAQGIL